MKQIRNGRRPGVMVPVPQYPLYSATLTALGMERVRVEFLYCFSKFSSFGFETTFLLAATDQLLFG
jgi:aspartate/methionine/tyrosine aminotransferase